MIEIESEKERESKRKREIERYIETDEQTGRRQTQINRDDETKIEKDNGKRSQNDANYLYDNITTHFINYSHVFFNPHPVNFS